MDIPLTPNGENIEMGSKMKKQKDDEANKLEDPRKKPEPTAGLWAQFKWAVAYPLYTISLYTIPGNLNNYIFSQPITYVKLSREKC